MSAGGPGGRKVVAVSGGAAQASARLFEALGRLYPVDFRFAPAHDEAARDALIVLDDDVAAGLAAAQRGIPACVVLQAGGESRANGTQVRLGSAAALDETLRDQCLVEATASEFRPLAPLPGDRVLGWKGEQPFWLERPTAGAACQLVALAPPELRDGEYLVSHFHGSRFAHLLPLMNFLRQLTRDIDWVVASRRACLVFDDPSLHRLTYGFLDYRDLALHAREHNYFVSVATIPLDTWWVDRDVAELFRSNGPRLSLIVHGNNHVRNEMLRLESGARGRAAVAQSLQRMDRLERRHGMTYCRIMEPPYGKIDAAVFDHLLALKYEAALVTMELLVRENRATAWPAAIGLEQSAIVAGGLPVIPRIRASAFWKTDVMLAAFLRQPIVVALHHQDAANGMEALTEVARVVNGVGNIAWSDLRGVLQGNYAQVVSGERMRVRMCSRAVSVPVPAGVREVRVERPWLEAGALERVAIRCGRGALLEADAGTWTPAVGVEEGETLEVTSERAGQVDFASIAAPGLGVWPVARKLMMEARDRLTPAMSRVGVGGRSIRNPS